MTNKTFYRALDVTPKSRYVPLFLKCLFFLGLGIAALSPLLNKPVLAGMAVIAAASLGGGFAWMARLDRNGSFLGKGNEWARKFFELRPELQHLRLDGTVCHAYDSDDGRIFVQITLLTCSSDRTRFLDFEIASQERMPADIASGRIELKRGGQVYIRRIDTAMSNGPEEISHIVADALMHEIEKCRANADMKSSVLAGVSAKLKPFSGITTRDSLIRQMKTLSRAASSATGMYSEEILSLRGRADRIAALLEDNADPGARISGTLDFLVPRATELVRKACRMKPDERAAKALSIGLTLSHVKNTLADVEHMLVHEARLHTSSDALSLELASNEVARLVCEQTSELVPGKV